MNMFNIHISLSDMTLGGIVKAVDGLDVLENIQRNYNKSTILKLEITKYYIDTLSEHGTFNSYIEKTLISWNKLGSISFDDALEDAKERWLADLKKKYD